MYNHEAVNRAKTYILSKISKPPTLGLVLGSGLGDLAEEIKGASIIPYQEIPHFVRSTVDYHAGQLVIGELEGLTVLAMQGRFHLYEGYSMDEVTFPIRVMKALGVTHVIMTNASGGLECTQQPGDLMLVADHINLMGMNPLIGPNHNPFEERFPDMSQAYCPRLNELAKNVATEQQINLLEGVYVAFNGPSFETPAEIRMARLLGGQAVGMSTVPEVIVANHVGIKVLVISCICNMAAGILPQPITAEEVYEAAGKAKDTFASLLRGVVKRISS
ncbi:purine-nucleoside phosphorylase [Brevibacillus daliensis]|uniref:purine-nucleoside phosphorylase n=1 Tax=Brevibacillus daliensis TaxID=2892995 RepID=UPI001E426633|nr:purine-nucleoside phosphorylase [Brevibacillus daliensis]